jgi:hypothetical protein
MKIFTCDYCKQLLYFENSACLNCNHTVGFDAVQFDLLTLNKQDNDYLPVNNNNSVTEKRLKKFKDRGWKLPDDGSASL